jgi:hypothetical protein
MDHAWRGEAEGERSPAMADAASLMIAPSTGTWMRWNAGVAREPYSADGGPSAASVVGHLSFLQTKPNIVISIKRYICICLGLDKKRTNIRV